MKQRTVDAVSLIFAVLMILMIVAYGQPQAGLSKVKAFVGEWCNTDFDTRGITRVHIRQVDNQMKVHMWGRCHPTECDWGEETATIHQNGLVLGITWDHSFAVCTQELRLKPDSTLEVSYHTHYTDGSGRADQFNTDKFANNIVHDWSDETRKQ
jgi:hypothetical protein